MNQTYIIMPTIDVILTFLGGFDQTNLTTLRKNSDGAKCVLAWGGETPAALLAYEIVHGPVQTYNQAQILDVMGTSDWKTGP